MLRLARQIAAWGLIPLLVVTVVCGVAGRALAASVELFDANIRYTSGIFLPLSSYSASTIQPLTTDSWTNAARAISRVAADGASLILIRVTLPGGGSGAVRVSLTSGEPDTDPGSLWAVDDRHVVDRSRLGGAIDDPREPRRKLAVRSVGRHGQRFAFLLYRPPRNFDSASGSTSLLASRQAGLTVEFPGSSSMVSQSITIVRPLIVFIHGTGDDNDAWAQFPLWQNSANELGDFQPGTLPFQATRISFYWIWNSTGGVQENAETILPQLVTALRDWREASATAATQADVVTHSFGGFIARQVAQNQPDADPLTLDSLHNFRAAANWGHGPIHKLVTLAATHRGSAAANAAAYLNANGNMPGLVRMDACGEGEYIDKGALRDQMVLSPALQALEETRVPGHALVGSGRAVFDPSDFYNDEEVAIFEFDKSGGPYASAFNTACPLDTLANYIFNLDPNSPPVTGSEANNDCSVTPNYDLVVSAYSSQGLMPAAATTTALDLDPSGGLIGMLNHSALIDPSFGSAGRVAAVSDRVAFLLQQPTTSLFFSYFPAVASVELTPLEERFSEDFASSWLEIGSSCPGPSYQTACPVDPPYSSITVIPARLELEDSTPTPLYVYGFLNGQGVLAYSPTISSNCTVTLTIPISDPAGVVNFTTNDVTGAQTVVATGVGTATIEVTVQNVAGRVTVPVVVRASGSEPDDDPGGGRRSSRGVRR